MASLDHLEGDVTEGVGALLGVLLLVLVVWAFLKSRNLHWPIALYPYQMFSGVASGVDNAMGNTGMYNSSAYTGIAKRVDGVLGAFGAWLSEHTPDASKSPRWADYVAQFDGSGSVETGGD